MDFATRYSPPKSPVLVCDQASLTRQEYGEESDLNNIMAKYAAGLAPIPSGSREPLFGDYSQIPDYQESLNIVMDAQDRFAQLPSKVRKEFDNDPARLLDFLADPKNRSRAVELGLIEDQKAPEPQKQAPEPQKQASEASEETK